jgi:hypothetical protein
VEKAMSQLIITLGNDQQSMDLVFDVLDIPVAQRWLDQVRMFCALGSPFDDRERFYNFPHTRFTREYCVEHLNNLVNILRPWVPELQAIDCSDLDQNTLNQLHHVFEIYHGLYDDQKNNARYQRMPVLAQTAVSDLNIWIHRIETLGSDPRFVMTWHTKPIRLPLSQQDFEIMTLEESWGDLRLNYCEIGKTLECLWQDNDTHISPDAFKPMRHFSLDFVVKFGEHNLFYYQNRARAIWQYFEKNQKFFAEIGYTKHTPGLELGSITVAQIRYTGKRNQLIQEIGQHARIHAVTVID